MIYMPDTVPNVVIFGEPGVGKSSVVNMLAGKDVAGITAKSPRMTFEHQRRMLKLDGRSINIYDTAGLNENKLSPLDVFQRLYDLMNRLRRINLIVFVTRFRITSNTIVHHRLLRSIFCRERVPVVIAVTGREFERENDKWWGENKATFRHNGMEFDDYAIGTANQHMRRDPTYTQLQTRLRAAIRKHGNQSFPLCENVERADIKRRSGLEHAVIGTLRLFRQPNQELLRAYKDVLERNGVSEAHATQSMERVKANLARI
jgi:GTPase Era involved in 16S rRNA processing